MPIKDEILIPQNKDTSFDGDVLPGTDGRWNFGSLTKRWRKIIAKIINAINIEYTGNLKPARGDTVYTGCVFVPADTVIEHTSFDGDSFSDVGSNTKIENTSWSTTIPEEARAILASIACRDSGSAANGDLYVWLFSSASASVQSLSCWPGGKTNDAFSENQGVVPCTNGDIWYRVNASGTNTMDIWLRVYGYWI